MSAMTGPLAVKIRQRRFFEYSRSRAGEYPQEHLAGWTGIMQADAFSGFNELYEGATEAGSDYRSRMLEPLADESFSILRN